MIEIVSSRNIFKQVYWQIVYEWEDEFASSCNLKILNSAGAKKGFFEKIYFQRKLFPFMPKGSLSNYKIYFSMVAPYEYNFYSMPNYIPIIIDAWRPDLWRIEQFCRHNKLVFLGSLEAVQALQSRGVENVHYGPISLSKKNKIAEYPAKDIDLLVYGRNHIVMFEWVDRMWNTSSLHIVRAMPDKNGVYNAYSNKRGHLGSVEDRRLLIDLIKRSKYATVSSTGNDPRDQENVKYTGGFSPVTPRFLEVTANYAQGIGIFPSNPDFNYFDIASVAKNTVSFEEFEYEVNQQPNPDFIKPLFDAFLENHWTEKRSLEIVQTILSSGK